MSNTGGNNSALLLGIQSLHDLGVEFLATVLGSGPTGQTSVVCGVGDDDNLQTTFYLNPFEPGPCAGSDWFGTNNTTIVLIVHRLLCDSSPLFGVFTH